MSDIPEEVKKQLLDYPFVTAVTTPQAGKIWEETAKSPDMSIKQGVRA